jgi:hypothetical protein
VTLLHNVQTSGRREGEITVEIRIPEPSDILAGIADVQVEVAGDKRSIAQWREWYREELTTAQQKPPLSIFCRFVNSLRACDVGGIMAATAEQLPEVLCLVRGDH